MKKKKKNLTFHRKAPVLESLFNKVVPVSENICELLLVCSGVCVVSEVKLE